MDSRFSLVSQVKEVGPLDSGSTVSHRTVLLTTGNICLHFKKVERDSFPWTEQRVGQSRDDRRFPVNCRHPLTLFNQTLSRGRRSPLYNVRKLIHLYVYRELFGMSLYDNLRQNGLSKNDEEFSVPY